VPGGEWFYVSSLSHRTVVYKGMLMPEQVGKYYPDLRDADLATGLALVHSRFSTNTFPSWDRSHPYRYIAHNGEINTLRGNINWMHAGQSSFRSDLFADIKKILPVVNTDGSDSAMFDNSWKAAFSLMAGSAFCPLDVVVLVLSAPQWTKVASSGLSFMSTRRLKLGPRRTA
jgi:glutamate synthase domain-containing protein 1